jgi:hypothetical protein
MEHMEPAQQLGFTSSLTLIPGATRWRHVNNHPGNDGGQLACAAMLAAGAIGMLPAPLMALEQGRPIGAIIVATTSLALWIGYAAIMSTTQLPPRQVVTIDPANYNWERSK